MDAKTFADFFALQGHKVIETESCYWYNAFPFFYQSIPYHRIIRPPAKEIETIFLLTAPEHTFLNSSIVRDILRHGGNASEFIPGKINLGKYGQQEG